MPITPDPVAMLDARVTKLEGAVAALEAAPPSPTPPGPDVPKAFEAKWALVSPADFKAKYGVDYGKPIPNGQLPEPDVDEMSYRARCLYNGRYGTPGVRCGQDTAPLVAAVSVIAHATQDTATQFYECGEGDALACDPDALVYGWYEGVFATKAEYQQSLGTRHKPSEWAGVSLALACARAFGGSPSGG